MNQIQSLIASNRISEALSLLPKSDEKFLLESRYNRHKKQCNLGLVTNSQAQVERNRIVSAILELSGDAAMNVEFITQQPRSNSTAFKPYLLNVIKENKRRRPAIADEARGFVSTIDEYEGNKATEAGFDRSGRRWKSIQQSVEEFRDKLADAKAKSIDGKAKEIMDLIDDPVPSYKDLSSAWSLSQGLGMSSSWIPNALANKPNDDEVKIRIAEEIEEFVDQMNIK